MRFKHFLLISLFLGLAGGLLFLGFVDIPAPSQPVSKEIARDAGQN